MRRHKRRRKLLRNRVWALFLIIIGFASTKIDNDWTFFVAVMCMAIPLLAAKENIIE